MGISVIHFNTPVSCVITRDADGVPVAKATYDDYSVLMLPDTYSDAGEPTRLVIWCHGAGGTVATDDSQTETNCTAKYLVANSYAVLDTNGLPFEYADANGISRLNNVGSPISVEAYVKAYRCVVENYNIAKDGVFVGGGSMGGISGTNLVMSGKIPVIAQGTFCPVLDTYHEIFQHPWSGGLPKVALAKLFGFSKDPVTGDFIYDEEKVAGYNPVNNGVSEVNGKRSTHYPCPVKFWQCEDDPIVDISVTKSFVRQINNAGGTAYLRTFPNGGHEPQDAGEILKNASGRVNYCGERLAVRAATEELLQWFNEYNEKIKKAII